MNYEIDTISELEQLKILATALEQNKQIERVLLDIKSEILLALINSYFKGY